MKRNRLLLPGTAALIILAGCSSTAQNGGTGATPSGMPGDTMMTDTTTSDTLTAAPQSEWSGVLALGEAQPGK